MTETLIVVPCYNEAQRLPGDAFASYCDAHPWVRFLFVNDGSSDRTLEVVQTLADTHPLQISTLDQQPNAGKAEAVRVGMLEALKSGAAYVGYWDADLATGLDEIPRFVRILDEHPEYEIVFGSRVKLLGRTIERRALRHYPGRICATFASLTLGLPVYDTQCGAKLFRSSLDTERLFEAPFLSNWLFDVELVARLIRARRYADQPGANKVIYELPLLMWRDIGGSQVRAVDFLKSFWELAQIYRTYLR
jgi:dolichyl-phosphate beta-glucosyltransferase